MKLMLFIPHAADGGAEKLLSQLSIGLQAGEKVVTVFEKRIDYPLGGRLISLDSPIRRGILNRVAGLATRILRFRKILKQEKPDVVVSFMGEANILNALLSKRPILTVHNHLSSLERFGRRGLERKLGDLLVSTLYRRASTVVAVSSAVRDDVVEVFGVPADHVKVISNAINAEEVRKLAAEPANVPWKPGVPVIITAGRLTALKGQWHLIDAFEKVRRRIPCQLAILGAGELEQQLRDTAKKLGVEDDTYFLGWQANPWKFLSKANVFVLPSLTEGFGLALLEAMACGLPVVATDCSGAIRDILAPSLSGEPEIDDVTYADYGVLTPRGDNDRLATAIRRILSEPSLSARYVDLGSRRALDFNYPELLERYQQLIDSTCQSHPL
jgi:glycosyltransferase involved in cell wall biosynthesis